jgi:glycosyltransferase 2 family protein
MSENSSPSPQAANKEPAPAIAEDGQVPTVTEVSDGSPELSLLGLLKRPRTITAIVVPVALLLLAAVALPGFHVDRIWAAITRANAWLLGAALVAYYLSFPIRGYRWRQLLAGAGMETSKRDATEILFLSWFVNCLAPAKLGDLYRAYLLGLSRGWSLSGALGTILVERILDLEVIAILGIAMGYLSFAAAMPSIVRVVLVVAAVTAVALSVALFALRSFGAALIARLPVPASAAAKYERFEAAAFSSVRRRTLPRLAGLTVAIWATEAAHLALVVAALNFADVHLGVEAIVFVALAGALLTAFPLSPAGLGAVETGVVGILTLAYAVPPSEAVAIAVLDRAVTVLSVIAVGCVAYALSDKTGRRQASVIV